MGEVMHQSIDCNPRSPYTSGVWAYTPGASRQHGSPGCPATTRVYLNPVYCSSRYRCRDATGVPIGDRPPDHHTYHIGCACAATPVCRCKRPWWPPPTAACGCACVCVVVVVNVVVVL